MANQYQTRAVYLTFDDGPSAEWTPIILDILEQYGARATFFVCGKNVKRYPELIKRIAQEGHSVGNHTYSHSYVKTHIGILKTEIEQTSNLIQKTTGTLPNLLRFPWGHSMPWVVRQPYIKKYKVYRWTLNSNDWAGASAKTMYKNIIAKLCPGSIVLMHDGKETRKIVNRSQTATLLPMLLLWIQKNEYVCKPLA